MPKKKTEDFIELNNGATLYFLPVSQEQIQKEMVIVEEEFRQRGEPVDVPTYETVPGERVEWDEKSLEKDGSPEEKEEWAKYIEARQRLAQEQEERVLWMILVDAAYKLKTKKGQDIDLSIDDITGEWEGVPKGWLKRIKRRPDNDYDLKYQYLRPIVSDVITQRDIISLCVTLSVSGAMTKEGRQALRDLFRDQMARQARIGERQIRQIIDRNTRSITEGNGESGPLDNEPEMDAEPMRKVLGNDT